jgi:hypothetical protein
VDYDNNVNPTVYVNGQTIQTRLQPFTATGELDLASCPIQYLLMNNRASRPIAPANIVVNGVYRPKTLASWATTLNWARRDRLDTAKIRSNTDPDYMPENGTFYRIAIREKIFPDSSWTAGASVSGIDGISRSLVDLYTPQSYSIEITMSAILGSLTSLQNNVVTLVHSPWIPDVLSLTLTNPPVSPANGATYVVPTGASGVWASQVGKLAKIVTGSWRYYQPTNGQQVKLSGNIYTFNGSSWEVGA